MNPIDDARDHCNPPKARREGRESPSEISTVQADGDRGCCHTSTGVECAAETSSLPTSSCCDTMGEPTLVDGSVELNSSTVGWEDPNRDLPVVVIGAGPVGLAAAANLAERGQCFLVLESGNRVAASMWQWRHVRLFTPWSFLLDPVGKRLLSASCSWSAPSEDRVPNASELIERFLDPLASHPAIAPHLKLDHKVISVSREGHDRMKNGMRNQAPFLLIVETPDGPQRIRARAVIDASGTWTTPNPLGAGGVPADGEQQLRHRIQYGMPDVLDRDRDRYADQRVLVVGSGHSATGNILSLVELAKTFPGTSISWGIRRKNATKLWGGGNADEIAERGRLGDNAKHAVEQGKVTLLTDLSVTSLRETDAGTEVIDVAGDTRVIVDEIIVASGARPDLTMHRELRLEFDPATEAAKNLGPLIDPNHHSCGSVPPHGAEQLRQPEQNFFFAGMKSYGRAPTFLLMTGYEQVRSIVAALSGDHQAARKVELELPSTGVCSTDFAFAEDTSPPS
ncbi:NAD(P)-binding domain-containing protein [Roseiconus lacunae]|uniref:NAD(P)-binding domain-containing protein n=1 Tax=Roseiconus lacunae TaxID=2605694 RepID=UPI0030862084|nr:NAD(P)-binding domain-containing protein [Stieleria sp. HD01]